MVARDAAINYTNKYGNTPIMEAPYSGKLENCHYFTQIGADINICDNNNNALHSTSVSDCLYNIELLLDKAISVNLTNKDEFTPLHVTAQFDHVEATKSLVEGGAAINSTNRDGITPLMVSTYSGKSEIIRYLTEIGADINIRDDNNNTAIHLVVESGSVDIVQLLLDKGMLVNLTNLVDYTAFLCSMWQSRSNEIFGR